MLFSISSAISQATRASEDDGPYSLEAFSASWIARWSGVTFLVDSRHCSQLSAGSFLERGTYCCLESGQWIIHSNLPPSAVSLEEKGRQEWPWLLLMIVDASCQISTRYQSYSTEVFHA